MGKESLNEKIMNDIGAYEKEEDFSVEKERKAAEKKLRERLSSFKEEEERIREEIGELEHREKEAVDRICFFFIGVLVLLAVILILIPHGLFWLSVTVLLLFTLLVFLHFSGLFSIPYLIYRGTKGAAANKEAYRELEERILNVGKSLEALIPESEEERREKETEIAEFERTLAGRL